jgi:hypothetical protein
LSLRRKPHIFVLIPVSKTNTNARIDVPEEGSPRSIRCQITPISTESAIRQFGDIQIRRPHLMLCDVADGRTIKTGDRGEFDSREFFVKADPMIWNAGETTDCCQILIDQKQFA